MDGIGARGGAGGCWRGTRSALALLMVVGLAAILVEGSVQAASAGANTEQHSGAVPTRSCWSSRPLTTAGRCAVPARGGQRYAIAAAYRSTSGLLRIHVAVRTADGWHRFSSVARSPRNASWSQLRWTTPALPEGTTALSVGHSSHSRLSHLTVRPRPAVADAMDRRVRPTAGASPTAPASAASAALPPRVAGVYWTNWGKGTALDQLPAPYNVIYAAFAYGDGSGTGRVVFRPDDGSGVSATQFASQVRNVQATGDRVLLSIGGANPVGLKLLTAQNVADLLGTLEPIVDQYGFNGIDWDLEQDSTFTVDNLLSVSRALKSRYGPGFAVTATPAPSDVPYKRFAQRAGDLLDYIAPQYYGYADSNRLAGIRSRTAELITTYGVPASKIGIGAEVGTDSSTALATFWRDAVAALRSSYPGFRGAQVWEATREQNSGNPFAGTVTPTILQ